LINIVLNRLAFSRTAVRFIA